MDSPIDCGTVIGIFGEETAGDCTQVLNVASSQIGGGQDQSILFSRGLPEPSTLALLGLGLLGLGVTARRRNAV